MSRFEPVFVLKQLSSSELRAFIDNGFLLLHDVFDRRLAQSIIPLVWKEMEELEDAPLTWIQPIRIVKKVLADLPIDEILTERYRASLDDLCGSGKWETNRGVGYWLNIFPQWPASHLKPRPLDFHIDTKTSADPNAALPRMYLGISLALSRNMIKTFLDWHPTVMHDLHESVPYLYIMTGTGPYNAWLDPIVISEWQEMAYHEIEEMTKRGVVGVWTHGFYDGWAPNYLLSIGNNHNAIGRFYETFGNGGADTRVRTLRPTDTNREWFRPNPPLAKVKWSARNNINMQESAILFGMNNLASHGAQFLNNFYLKSKRAVEKARKEGPAAWVFPADDPRPGEQARLLSVLQFQGVEVHRTEKEIRVPAAESARETPARESGARAEKSDKTDKPDAKPDTKEDKKPAETVFPAGSYVVRMDQPYSRLADMVLDTQYYSSRDPRSYDDTGWTLGALRNVKTTRVTDLAVLDAPMQKVSKLEVAGNVDGQGKTFLIQHNTESSLATLRFRLASTPMEAAANAVMSKGSRRPGHDGDGMCSTTSRLGASTAVSMMVSSCSTGSRETEVKY
jgi:hypothetical protein